MGGDALQLPKILLRASARIPAWEGVMEASYGKSGTILDARVRKNEQ